MSSNNIAIGAQTKLRCLSCRTVTHHELRFIHPSSFVYDDAYDPATTFEQPDHWELRSYRLWVCAGCESARLEIVSQEFTSYEPEPDPEISIFYPEYEAGKLTPKRFTQLSHELQNIYQEVIVSYNNNLHTLCAIGLRALLEGICVDRGIKDWGLEKKLEKLRIDNHLPSNIVDALYRLKIMGDESAHRLIPPDDFELKHRSLLQKIYSTFSTKLSIN